MLHGLSIKIPKTFFTEIQKSTLKFIWKYKRSQIARKMLSKKCNAVVFTILDFKHYYRDLARYWHKSTHDDQ
jgi:hypothetical protein